MLGTLQWTHQDSHLNSRPIQACSRGGIFQPWQAKFSSDPVTSTSWRSDVHGRQGRTGGHGEVQNTTFVDFSQKKREDETTEALKFFEKSLGTRPFWGYSCDLLL